MSFIFGRTFTDILSGYRVFSQRYVKSFAAHSAGFEIETELTVHALALRMPVAEVSTVYKSRPEGSVSKLNTYRDGSDHERDPHQLDAGQFFLQQHRRQERQRAANVGAGAERQRAIQHGDVGHQAEHADGGKAQQLSGGPTHARTGSAPEGPGRRSASARCGPW